MIFRSWNTPYRALLFLRSASITFHPLAPLLHARLAVFLILTGILLVGGLLGGVFGIIPPSHRRDSADFDLRAAVQSPSLEEETKPSTPEAAIEPEPTLALANPTKETPLEELAPPSQEEVKPTAPADLPPDNDPLPEAAAKPKDEPADLPDLANPEPIKEERGETVELEPAGGLRNAEPEYLFDETVRSPHRGDTPMRSTWQSLGLTAVLAAALTASPLLADPPKTNSDTLKDKQELAEIKKLLEGINQSLGSLGRMEKEMEELRFDRDVRVKSMQSEIAELKKQIASMRADLSKVLGADGSRRVAFSAPTTFGTIRIVSTYAEPATVLVNNVSYEVMPGQTLTLDRQPAGRFVYEVPASGRRVTRTLAADEMFTIRLFNE